MNFLKRDAITGRCEKYNPLNKRKISNYELDEIFCEDDDCEKVYDGECFEGIEGIDSVDAYED